MRTTIGQRLECCLKPLVTSCGGADSSPRLFSKNYCCQAAILELRKAIKSDSARVSPLLVRWRTPSHLNCSPSANGAR
eukprot:3977524-Amphidinium_carterae.1